MLQSEDMKTSQGGNFQKPEQPPDSIQRITLEYHSKASADTSAGKIEIDYSEQLVMDHNEEKLELVKTVGRGCRITHTFFLPYAIRNLLDQLEPEQWQKPFAGCAGRSHRAFGECSGLPWFLPHDHYVRASPGAGVFRLF